MDGSVRSGVGAALGAEVVAVAPVHGGDVAQAFRLDLDDGRRCFAKVDPTGPAGWAETEATDLRWLAEAGSVGVPAVLAVGPADAPFLVLAWIAEGHRAKGADAPFGAALADLHRAGAPCFGRADRRATGSDALPNEPCATWAECYAANRLLPLARLARDRRALPPTALDGLERLAGRIDELVPPPEPPSRLHGDLWGGNRLVGEDGRSWLIDPACLGGHRELDLAMMALFGGFGPEAFDAYDAAHPLADGWRERVPLHQVAPLVVHAVRFGGGYVAAAEAAIGAYG